MTERLLLPLSAIEGQAAAVETLTRLAHRDRPCPPLLLHGPEGTGKRTAALAFAAALVCTAPKGVDACGVCNACRRIAESGAVTEMRADATGSDTPRQYPDAGYVSVPEGKTRISVLQARDIGLSMQLQPYELPRRIYIVDPADSLNAAAANALLKVLEEPPDFGVLILITASRWSLPTTVLSRLAPVPFRPLADDALLGVLAQQGVTGRDARDRVAGARGSVARALTLDPREHAAALEAWVEILTRLSVGDRSAALAIGAGERFGSSPADARTALELLVDILRDIGAVARGGTAVTLAPANVEPLAASAAQLLGPSYARAADVDRLRGEIVTYNRNPRLAVEGAVLALAGITGNTLERA